MNDLIKKGVQEITLTANALCKLLPEKIYLIVNSKGECFE